MRRITAAVLAVATALATGCAGRPGNAEPKTVHRTEQIPVTVSIKLEGALAGEADKRTVNTQLVILHTDDPELQRNRIYGLETVDPIKMGKSSVTAGFALLPYRGPGKYSIGEGSLFDAAANAASQGERAERSSVKVLWRPDAEVEEVYDYYRREERCRLTIEDDGAKGELKCPRLTNEERKQHFSLELRWQFAEQKAEQQQEK